MHRNWLPVLSLVIATILFFAVNIYSNETLSRWRVDLTENNLYTLSEGTRSILAGLDEPLTLRYFLSREVATGMPAIASYARRVEALLEEYQRYAGGMIDLRIVDPEPFSVEEAQAQRYGLRAIPVKGGEESLYFGLAGSNSVDDVQTIAFFSRNREKLLEYDLTRLVYRLDRIDPPVVGLVSALPMRGGRSRRPWLIVDRIEKLFSIKNVAANTDRIPQDVDVLLIVRPTDLGKQTLYAIDQFVLSGGRALVFVDPYMESHPSGPVANHAGVQRLLDAWGVRLVEGKIAADMTLAEQVRYLRNRRQVVGEFPVWLNIRPAYLNHQDVVTANLGNIFMATPGVLDPRKGAGTRFTPLIQTSDQAAKLDTAVIRAATTPADVIEAFKPGSKPLTLAARISGPATTAFPGGPPGLDDAASTADKDSPPKLAPNLASNLGQQVKSSDDINVVVVADVDMLDEQFWARRQSILGSTVLVPIAANADFVVNVLENLTGSNDLIGVRSRGKYSRPFTRIAALRRGAELKYRRKRQELLDRLHQTEQSLRELEQGKHNTGNRLMLTAAQQREVDKFREEKLRIKKDLRAVQHRLRKDIEDLEGWLKFIDIGLIPVLIIVGAGIVSVRRARRRHSH